MNSESVERGEPNREEGQDFYAHDFYLDVKGRNLDTEKLSAY